MKAQSLVLCTMFVLYLSSEALAVKTETRMSPKNLEHVGFTLDTRERDDGSILVTITRDTTKAHWPKRDGALEILGDSERIVWCRLEPKKNKDKVTYEFIVSPKRLADTIFTVGEVQTANGQEDGEQVIGGGDYYRFRLADFAEMKLSKKVQAAD
jgi:hypothetical protein